MRTGFTGASQHPASSRPRDACSSHSPCHACLGPPALGGAGAGRQRPQHGTARHGASPQLPWQLGEQTFRDTVCQWLQGHCLGPHHTPPLSSPPSSFLCPSPAPLSSNPLADLITAHSDPRCPGWWCRKGCGAGRDVVREGMQYRKGCGAGRDAVHIAPA